MDVLRLVEDDLRALCQEARKKHPVVKEAAERGILKLRALREQYAAAVREAAGESPPVSMFRSQDLLRPFLLACNHQDCTPKMIQMALGAVAHLINRDAIFPSDAPNILRVLAIQAVSPSATPEVQVRVLQTLLLTVNWRSCDIPEDMLSSALVVCIQLSEHKNATVRNAASATLRQIISLLFDRVAGTDGGRDDDEDDDEGGGQEGDEDLDWSQAQAHKSAVESQQRQQHQHRNEPEMVRALRPVERSAYYLIQDLCLLSRGEQGTWLKHVALPQTLGVELIDQIIGQRPQLFRDRPVYTDVIRNQVCPLIVQTLRSALDFPLLVRLMRTINTVVSQLAELLVPQCEVILTMLLQILGGEASGHGASHMWAKDEGFVSSRSPKLGVWSVMLALEVLGSVCQDGRLLLTTFRNYDMTRECTNVFAGLVKGLTRYVTEGSISTQAIASLHAAAQGASWNRAGVPNVSRGFELMKESGPPAISDGEALMNAVACMLGLAETLSRLTIDTLIGGPLRPAISSSLYFRRGGGDDVPGFIFHALLIKEDAWRDLLQFFIHILSASLGGNDKLYDGALLGFEKLSVSLILLGILPARAQV
jgi:hypothetical protein